LIAASSSQENLPPPFRGGFPSSTTKTGIFHQRYMFRLMTFAAHQKPSNSSTSSSGPKISAGLFWDTSQHLNAILMSLKYSGLHFQLILFHLQLK